MREFGRLLKNESKRKGGRERRERSTGRQEEEGDEEGRVASAPPSFVVHLIASFFPPSSPHFILYHPLHHFSSSSPSRLLPDTSILFPRYLNPPSSIIILSPPVFSCLPIFTSVPPHPRVSPLRLLFSRSLSSSSPPGCLLNERMNKNEATVVFHNFSDFYRFFSIN